MAISFPSHTPLTLDPISTPPPSSDPTPATPLHRPLRRTLRRPHSAPPPRPPAPCARSLLPPSDDPAPPPPSTPLGPGGPGFSGPRWSLPPPRPLLPPRLLPLGRPATIWFPCVVIFADRRW